MWGLSSAGRASALQAEGHRFEPCRPHQFCRLGSMAEQLICNQQVVGSTPTVGSILIMFIPVVSWVQIPLSLLSKVEAVDASTFFVCRNGTLVAMRIDGKSWQPCLHGLGTLYGFTMSTATTTERISGV
jgi:hypothetical protein